MKYIQISSKYRTNPTDKPSACKIEMPIILRRGLYRLAFAVFPVSFYTIDERNDTIPLKDSANVKLAKIKHGFYDSTSILSAVKNALDEVGSQVYTVELDDITKKLTISAPNDFGFMFKDYESTAHHILGFLDLNTEFKTSHESTSIINLNSVHTINVSIDGILSIEQKNLQGSTFCIPVPAGQLGYVNYISDKEFTQYLHLQSDKRIISVNIFTDTGEALDLNGCDYLMILEQVEEYKNITTQLRFE